MRAVRSYFGEEALARRDADWLHTSASLQGMLGDHAAATV